MKRSYLTPSVRAYGSIESLTRATGEQGVTDRFIDARNPPGTSSTDIGSYDVCWYPTGQPDACDPFYD
jgi:hypothetical protein